MQTELILEEIGLTKNETILYLTLIKLGQSKTGQIIKESNLHSSKVYEGLERLQEKGLVSYVVQSNTKHFKAVNPNRLIDFLKEKKKKLDEQEIKIKEIIPKLLSQHEKGLDETQAEVFKGWKGLDTAYNMLRSTLRKEDMNYVIGASTGEDKEKTRDFFNKHVRLMAEKGLKQKIIYNEEARGNIEETYKYKNLFKTKYMKNTTPAEINIWKDTTMIIILRENPTLIMIKDKKVADSFIKYFEIMWLIAKP